MVVAMKKNAGSRLYYHTLGRATHEVSASAWGAKDTTVAEAGMQTAIAASLQFVMQKKIGQTHWGAKGSVENKYDCDGFAEGQLETDGDGGWSYLWCSHERLPELYVQDWCTSYCMSHQVLPVCIE